MSATVPQWRASLDYANELRLEGSRIRALMASHPMDESRRIAAELLRDPPPAIAHMRTGHFISGIKRFGQQRAVRIIIDSGLRGSAWDRRVGPLDGPDKHGRLPLTARQREALALELERGL